MTKYTQWFSGDEKPARVGVYQRDLGDPVLSFSFWDGARWSLSQTYLHDAYCYRACGSVFQNEPWRGILKGAK